jgi:ABC-type uncharacterized transport system permease subunit
MKHHLNEALSLKKARFLSKEFTEQVISLVMCTKKDKEATTANAEGRMRMQMTSISASLNWESYVIVCIFNLASLERCIVDPLVMPIGKLLLSLSIGIPEAFPRNICDAILR